MDSIDCISLNVRGLRNSSKRKRIFMELKQRKTDIICLQETYVTEEVIEQWKIEWGGEIVFFEGTRHGRGQMILFRKGFHFNWITEFRNDRILGVRIKAERETVIFNVYAPCGRKETIDFFNNLEQIVNESVADLKVLCGDFNAVMCNEKDIISGEKHPIAVVKAFNELVDQCELNDIWRISNADCKEYTWSRKTKDNFVSRRLDYILLNENATNAATHTQHFSVPSTDHRGVLLSLKFSETIRGPGYYKFNNALLKDS